MIQYFLSVVRIMRNITRGKFIELIGETIYHRKAVLKSGLVLATDLYNNNEKELAEQLIQKCIVHDISKLEDTIEFAALSSIIHQKNDMKNIEHELTDEQKKCMFRHWANNEHHPEHFPDHNMMNRLNLLDMGCDLHARGKQMGNSSLDYLAKQQGKRYHFDRAHYTYLRDNLTILEEKLKYDTYWDVFNTNINFLFSIGDPIVAHLENFQDTSYLDRIETDRLILIKSNKTDFASIYYKILLKDTEKKIGEITILCNGKIYYRIPRAYQNQFYIKEILLKFKDIIKRKELSIEIGKTNLLDQQMVNELGFVTADDSISGIRTFKFTKQ